MLKLTNTEGTETVWFQLWVKNKSNTRNNNGVWYTPGIKYPLIYDDSRFHTAYEKLTSQLYLPFEVGKVPAKDKPLVIDHEKAKQLYRDSNGVPALIDIFSDCNIQPEQKPGRKKSKKKVNDIKATEEIVYDRAILNAVEKYKKGEKLPKGLVTLARKFLGEI